MEDLTDMRHISGEVTESGSLEERIKVIEEKLNILIEQFDDLLGQNTTAPGTSEKPELPSNPVPTKYDYDDWYSNHGQGD